LQRQQSERNASVWVHQGWFVGVLVELLWNANSIKALWHAGDTSIGDCDLVRRRLSEDIGQRLPARGRKRICELNGVGPICFGGENESECIT
jgi:hypothetical protein